MSKKCTRCNIAKPIEAFGKETKGKDGLKSRCKVCSTEIRREQYLSNIDKEIAYGKDYRALNIEKEKARCTRYRECNPEKVKESQAKFKEMHPERAKESRRKWVENNKNLINQYTKANRDTRREFLDIIKLENGCAICGYKEHPRALQFDHIDPSNKSFGISSGLTYSMSKLLAELEKCRVLCANCHSIHTWTAEHWKNKTKDKNEH